MTKWIRLNPCSGCEDFCDSECTARAFNKQLKRERELTDELLKAVKIMKFAFSTKGGRMSPTDREIYEAVDESIAAIHSEREGSK